MIIKTINASILIVIILPELIQFITGKTILTLILIQT